MRVKRPRLERFLNALSAAPITILRGRAGCGKSELLRGVRNDAEAIYFRAGDEHATFARFVRGLAQAVAPIAPGAQASFPRVWERALQSRSPANVLAHWLCEHLQSADYPLAIDDLHDAAADPSIAAFIAKLAELRPNRALRIAVRSVGALPVALWMATRRMNRPIDEADLRFNAVEVAAAARQAGVDLNKDDVTDLLGATDGLPVAVAYALADLRRNPRPILHMSAPSEFFEIAAAIFARRSARQRELLFTAALFPRFNDELLGLCGYADAFELRDTLVEDAEFMWEQNTTGELQFHDRFRNYVAERFAAYDERSRRRIAKAVIGALRSVGRYSDALEVATRQHLVGMTGEILNEHGYQILESGAVDVISEALDAFELHERSRVAKIFALRGYRDARRGRLDIAESWFRLGLETAHDETSRVAVALYYARELTLRRREDAYQVLAPFANSTTLPRSEFIDVRSSAAQGLAAANRLAEARSYTDEALALLDAGASAALRARVFARAAYVANECGAFELARERALIAAPLAIGESLYEVAVSAYSVLYAIAYADDDPALCRKYLHCVRDMGGKSGSSRFELYALLGLFELYAEAGDEDALADLKRQLAAADKYDAGVEIMEALLPGKALQAAWTGEFAAAAELVRPTAEQYATPERRALSWAQIRVFLTATGDDERARHAVCMARDTLGQVQVRTTLSDLTLLMLALGAWTGGAAEEAREWIDAADQASIDKAPRLRALRDALVALDGISDESGGCWPALARSLADLQTASFGGLARLIEALPLRRAAPAYGLQTIGTKLAELEFPDRLDAALEAGSVSALRAWLDALPGFTARELPVLIFFERWATCRAREPRTDAEISKLRRGLAAYKPRAPALRTIVDDVDVSIAKLFDHLDVASPLTAEHSRAVSAWCSRIARMLGLSEGQVQFLTRCGLIHDIGKMRTPGEILNAPRGLSSTEWSVMKEHAAQGSRMVADVLELRSFIPVVRGHHERLDGKGYPDGLRLGAIPLAARIVAVADSFNAMIARRPYRVPLAPNAALNELQGYAGTQFDPEIVSAMIRVVCGQIGPECAGV